MPAGATDSRLRGSDLPRGGIGSATDPILAGGREREEGFRPFSSAANALAAQPGAVRADPQDRTRPVQPVGPIRPRDFPRSQPRHGYAGFPGRAAAGRFQPDQFWGAVLPSNELRQLERIHDPSMCSTRALGAPGRLRKPQPGPDLRPAGADPGKLAGERQAGGGTALQSISRCMR